jgi:hypothetical protein
LQAAQAIAQSKACKRASTFPRQRRISKFFPNAFKKIKHPTHSPTRQRKMILKLNNDNGLQTRWTKTPAGNSGFASCGVKCLNSSAVFQINFSAGLTVLCPEIPHERKAAKRWR